MERNSQAQNLSVFPSTWSIATGGKAEARPLTPQPLLSTPSSSTLTAFPQEWSLGSTSTSTSTPSGNGATTPETTFTIPDSTATQSTVKFIPAFEKGWTLPEKSPTRGAAEAGDEKLGKTWSPGVQRSPPGTWRPHTGLNGGGVPSQPGRSTTSTSGYNTYPYENGGVPQIPPYATFRPVGYYCDSSASDSSTPWSVARGTGRNSNPASASAQYVTSASHPDFRPAGYGREGISSTGGYGLGPGNSRRPGMPPGAYAYHPSNTSPYSTIAVSGRAPVYDVVAPAGYSSDNITPSLFSVRSGGSAGPGPAAAYYPEPPAGYVPAYITPSIPVQVNSGDTSGEEPYRYEPPAGYGLMNISPSVPVQEGPDVIPGDVPYQHAPPAGYVPAYISPSMPVEPNSSSGFEQTSYRPDPPNGYAPAHVTPLEQLGSESTSQPPELGFNLTMPAGYVPVFVTPLDPADPWGVNEASYAPGPSAGFVPVFDIAAQGQRQQPVLGMLDVSSTAGMFEAQAPTTATAPWNSPLPARRSPIQGSSRKKRLLGMLRKSSSFRG